MTEALKKFPQHVTKDRKIASPIFPTQEDLIEDKNIYEYDLPFEFAVLNIPSEISKRYKLNERTKIFFAKNSSNEPGLAPGFYCGIEHTLQEWADNTDLLDGYNNFLTDALREKGILYENQKIKLTTSYETAEGNLALKMDIISTEH